MTSHTMPNVINVDEVPDEIESAPEGWVSFNKALTPALPRMGHLGMNLARVPPGQSACPFHAHQIEDEIFFVVSGRGVFRYGDRVTELRPGDAVSCPAGTGMAHQIANPFEADLVYLAIGMNDPNEVAIYPDSGQVLVRSLKRRGFLEPADCFEGQPSPSPIMTMRAEPRSSIGGDQGSRVAALPAHGPALFPEEVSQGASAEGIAAPPA